jgi:proline iminopeptidase
MPPIPAPRESGFTTSTDVPLYWARYGPARAKPVLVLHGGPGAEHDYLLPQMLELGAGTRELVFYDQRGGGKSKTEDRTPITWQTQVADLAAVIRELGLNAEPLSLAGYSWGGLLAMLYAIEAGGGRVGPSPGELLLIDPAPVNRAFRDQFEAEFARRQSGPEVKAMRDELNASGLKDTDPDQFRHRSFELSVAGYFADPRRARDLTPFRVIGRVQQSIWESLGNYDLATSDALGSVAARSIIVHGRQDPIPLASSERAAEVMGSEFVAIEDCGHVPYVEQPRQLFAALDRFLAVR